MAKFIIHRGSHQIGGICAEIKTIKSRIIIDMGTNLPGNNNTEVISDKQLLKSVLGTKKMPDAIFFTHYHGDHIGIVDELICNKNKKIYKGYFEKLSKCKLYIGETAINIKKTLWETIGLCKADEELKWSYIGSEPIEIGDIKVTPVPVNHSAVDAYMFLIEADGKTMLYTGDFRDHGRFLNREELLRSIESKINKNKVDYLVTEGTMLSRKDAHKDNKIMTESDLEANATNLFEKNKHYFVLVSSTNFDSIISFYKAAKSKKLKFICDRYQYDQLNNVKKYYEKEYGENDIIILEDINLNDYKEDGFVMLVRPTESFKNIINGFKERSSLIYSMWDGYIEKDDITEQNLRTDDYSISINDFLYSFNNEQVNIKTGYHTSGHASIECINKLIETVKPEYTLVMHSERTDEASEILNSDKFILLDDGDVLDMDNPENEKKSLYSEVYEVAGLSYKELAEKVAEVLENNKTIWEENFKRYYTNAKFKEKSEFLNQGDNSILEEINGIGNGIYVYSPVGSGKNVIQLRHSGALIARLAYRGQKRGWEIHTESAEKFFISNTDENSPKTLADMVIENEYKWDDNLKNFLKTLSVLHDSSIGKEHKLESMIHTAIETGGFLSLSPVYLVNGCRFQMPVPLSASDITKKNSFKFLETGKGNIDILAKGKDGRLNVIELKDSYSSDEKPEEAIKQAIIYAVFMRELLRDQNWKVALGFGEIDNVEINAVICMPYHKDMNIDNIKRIFESENSEIAGINLHYIFINSNENGVSCDVQNTSL